MSRKSRIELEDKLAEQFVFRTEQNLSSSSAVQPKENKLKSNRTTTKKTNIMSEISLPQKEPVMRLSVDLSLSLHERLDTLSKVTRRKKAEISRIAIEKFLDQVEKEFDNAD